MKKCNVENCDSPTEVKAKCRLHYNEYMAKYMLARYHRRRNTFIESRGGKCEIDGSTDRLEIDHKDHKDKSFDLGKALSGWSEKRIQAELAKCQVLCYDCHQKKTRKDLAEKFGQREHWEHGTLGGYRHCKEECCRSVWNAHCREYKRKRKLNNAPLV